jgi:hypothetical protein
MRQKGISIWDAAAKILCAQMRTHDMLPNFLLLHDTLALVAEPTMR